MLSLKKIKKKIRTTILKETLNQYLGKIGIKKPYSNLIKDKVLLYPIIKKSDFLYTTYNLTPNNLTFINMIFVSPLIIYFWITNYLLYASILLFIRNWLDGVDGYIARKYNLRTKEGEIYDHVADCIFGGMCSIVFSYKISLPLRFSLFLSQFIMISGIIIDFSPDWSWVSEAIFGAGGNDDGFCTLIYFILNLIIVIVS